MAMTPDGSIKLVITLAIFAIVISSILPGQLNAISATSLSNGSANSLWVLMPLLIVVVVVLFLLAQTR